MKKHLLFSIIGGIIIFAWQFLSYAMPNFHKNANEYTPLQDTLLSTFQAVGLEEGMYMLGQPNPDDPDATYDMSESSTWAVVNYQIDVPNSMTMPMVRGIIICIVIAALLFLFFKQQTNARLIDRLLIALGVGIIGFLYTPYTNYIWYREPDIYAHMLDAIVPYLILGWIGHLFLKGNKSVS